LFCQSVEVPSLPTNIIPVAVHLSPDTAIVRAIPHPMTIPDPSNPPAVPPPADFLGMMKNLPCWQQPSLLAHFDSEQTVFPVKELLEGGESLQLCLIRANEDHGSFA
jgi:hypothetical protein